MKWCIVCGKKVTNNNCCNKFEKQKDIVKKDFKKISNKMITSKNKKVETK